MKLYYFNPNNYGKQYFVMAESEEEAYESLYDHIEKNDGDDSWIYMWHKKELPRDYTLDVYEQGQVIQSEIC